MHTHQRHPTRDASGKYLAVLCMSALGVVFGDIGTSPLYAMRECFHGPHAVATTSANVFGVLSLIIWSLILVVSIKYLVLILRADNEGEGGILALMALVLPKDTTTFVARIIMALGLFGAALLYGDGAITPAISVLSAVEGLEVVTPVFKPWVLPLTLAILVGLFMVQYRGTGKVGAVFGPVTLLWFTVMGALGVHWIFEAPEVLRAVSPGYAATFLLEHKGHAFGVMGSVFLVVTGGEALYADMGHFGKKPIRIVWFALVLPALLLNYLGQGALLLTRPEAATNPFYYLAPAWGVLPLVVLATAATCIASQALISGAFSITRQAVQLGYLPRMEIRHTSRSEIGQIYIPTVNWLLLAGTILLVLRFETSSRLAGAYGIAVTTTMVITTALAYIAMTRLWGWSTWRAGIIVGSLGLIDLTFFGANVLKIMDGGWFPLVAGVAIYIIMTTWRDGRALLSLRMQENTVPVDEFMGKVKDENAIRVSGTAIYMTGNLRGAPPALVKNYRHNRAIHSHVVFLRVETAPLPFIPAERGIEISDLGNGFHRVNLTYGFMQTPDVPRALRRIREQGLLPIDEQDATYVLGRETLLASTRAGMAIWREKLFARMSRNAERATTFFKIPVDQVIEIGSQVEL